jgi:hypothetical protein
MPSEFSSADRLDDNLHEKKTVVVHTIPDQLCNALQFALNKAMYHRDIPSPSAIATLEHLREIIRLDCDEQIALLDACIAERKARLAESQASPEHD